MYSYIRGFSTNVANYQPIGELCASPCPLGATANGSFPDLVWDINGDGVLSTAEIKAASKSSRVRGRVSSEAAPTCCADPCGLLAEYNPANNELNYASLVQVLG